VSLRELMQEIVQRCGQEAKRCRASHLLGAELAFETLARIAAFVIGAGWVS